MNDTAALEPQTLTAEVTITPEARRLILVGERAEAALREAFGVIDSPEVADLAGHELTQIRKRWQQLDDYEKRFTKPALEIVEAARGLFRGAKTALKAADTFIAGQLSTWEVKQQQAADAARRAVEEAARAERTRQEAELAVARAKAEAEAQAALRRAEEAALQDANSAEAARALVDAEAAQVTAQVAAQAQTELGFTPLAVAPIEEARKVAGLSMAEHWISELDGPPAAVRAKLVAACAQRPELLELLEINMPTANKWAAALKSAFNVPGMRAVNRPIAKRSRT